MDNKLLQATLAKIFDTCMARVSELDAGNVTEEDTDLYNSSALPKNPTPIMTINWSPKYCQLDKDGNETRKHTIDYLLEFCGRYDETDKSYQFSFNIREGKNTQDVWLNSVCNNGIKVQNKKGADITTQVSGNALVQYIMSTCDFTPERNMGDGYWLPIYNECLLDVFVRLPLSYSMLQIIGYNLHNDDRYPTMATGYLPEQHKHEIIIHRDFIIKQTVEQAVNVFIRTFSTYMDRGAFIEQAYEAVVSSFAFILSHEVEHILRGNTVNKSMGSNTDEKNTIANLMEDSLINTDLDLVYNAVAGKYDKAKRLPGAYFNAINFHYEPNDEQYDNPKYSMTNFYDRAYDYLRQTVMKDAEFEKNRVGDYGVKPGEIFASDQDNVNLILRTSPFFYMLFGNNSNEISRWVYNFISYIALDCKSVPTPPMKQTTENFIYQPTGNALVDALDQKLMANGKSPEEVMQDRMKIKQGC